MSVNVVSNLENPLYHTVLGYALPSINIKASQCSNRDRQIAENLSLMNIPARRQCVMLDHSITKQYKDDFNWNNDPIIRIISQNQLKTPLKIKSSINSSITTNTLKRKNETENENEMSVTATPSNKLPTFTTPVSNRPYVGKLGLSNKKQEEGTPLYLKKPKLVHPLKKFKKEYGPNDSQTIKPGDVLKMIDSSLVSTDFDDSMMCDTNQSFYGTSASNKMKMHLEISDEDLNFAKNDEDYLKMKEK